MAYKAIHKKLHQWYQKYGRKDLPWRITDDPYHIWVSEVMLQQTQVSTVLERYYTPFLAEFPTIDVLAAAPYDKVMKNWEGLGYYRRAGNLHKAAQLVNQHYNSKLPSDIASLKELPGIGRNTAHAISCFGFNAPVPIMEANLRRVLCRFFALEKAGEKELWEKSYLLLDQENSFDYNQAMMDIGALICRKHVTYCERCPLAERCIGKKEPGRYPLPKVSKVTPIRKKNIIIYQNDHGELWLSARETNFLGGLYGFVEYDLAQDIKEANHLIEEGNGVHLGGVRQSYSHFILEADVWLKSGIPEIWPNDGGGVNGKWYSKSIVDKLPLSRADEKILRLFIAYEEEE